MPCILVYIIYLPESYIVEGLSSCSLPCSILWGPFHSSQPFNPKGIYFSRGISYLPSQSFQLPLQVFPKNSFGLGLMPSFYLGLPILCCTTGEGLRCCFQTVEHRHFNLGSEREEEGVRVGWSCGKSVLGQKCETSWKRCMLLGPEGEEATALHLVLLCSPKVIFDLQHWDIEPSPPSPRIVQWHKWLFSCCAK